MIDYEILRLVWWVLLGVLLIGFAVMDGFDRASGRCCPFWANRRRAPHHHQHRRPCMGRQSGLADLGRRRDFRRLARPLCRGVFGILSGDVFGAERSDPAPRGLQIPQQDAPSSLARVLGLSLCQRRCAARYLRRRGRQRFAGRSLYLRRHHAHDLYGVFS